MSEEKESVPRPLSPLEELDTRLKLLTSQMDLSIEFLKDMSTSFYIDLMRGVKAHKRHKNLWIPTECPFKMLDSYISNIPTGNEKGVFYAVDFGGSNYRAVRVKIDGDGKLQRTQSIFTLKYVTAFSKKGLLDKHTTATELFDHFAQKIGDVIKEANEANDPEPKLVGFTFSFPCTMSSKTSAILIDWTKDFETGRATNDQVEGRDVCSLLNEAFVRNKVNAKTAILINDTVGTLLSCCYQKPKGYPDCKIGLIIGTGCNICYIEPDYKKYGYEGSIVNVEMNNYDKDLPITPVDFAVDWETSNKGRDLYEKLLSGAYLGEVVRHYMILLLRQKATRLMYEWGSFTSYDAGVVLNDNDDLKESARIAKETWGADLTPEELKGLRKICEATFERSAALASVAIVSAGRRARAHPTHPITCAIDGSLYVKNPWYNKKLEYYVNAVSRSDLKGSIVLLAADDGSGKGAAIAAAMESQNL